MKKIIVALLSAIILLTACSDSNTNPDFRDVSAYMTMKQVRAIEGDNITSEESAALILDDVNVWGYTVQVTYAFTYPDDSGRLDTIGIKFDDDVPFENIFNALQTQYGISNSDESFWIIENGDIDYDSNTNTVFIIFT